MPRIRTIKPEFWRDEALASVSSEACLLAIGLLNHCDDEGYFNANKKLVEADIFPLRELSKNIESLLQELCIIGYLELLNGKDGKTYGHIKNFEKHQVISKKSESRIKRLCALPEDSDTTPGGLPEDSDTTPGGLPDGKEQEQEQEREREKQHPPTPQKGDACFSENVEKEKTQDTENEKTVLDRWINLKIQTGKNIMNVGGYKARLAKALSDGTASLQEMRSEIEKMQNELDNKKRKQQEMELILASNETQNDQKISNDAIMIFYHSLPTQEKEKIQNEVEKNAIIENPRFQYFPPTVQKMIRTAHLINICMPMLMEATKCAN